MIRTIITLSIVLGISVIINFFLIFKYQLAYNKQDETQAVNVDKAVLEEQVVGLLKQDSLSSIEIKTLKRRLGKSRAIARNLNKKYDEKLDHIMALDSIGKFDLWTVRTRE